MNSRNSKLSSATKCKSGAHYSEALKHNSLKAHQPSVSAETGMVQKG